MDVIGYFRELYLLVWKDGGKRMGGVSVWSYGKWVGYCEIFKGLLKKKIVQQKEVDEGVEFFQG